jgi:prepilin-type N-terminal cleavage/methylation domain-containing protein
MRRQQGSTLFELLAVLAVLAVFVAVAAPGASRARSVVAAAEAARRLALVLRAAQAQAQCEAAPVAVVIGDDGEYVVTGAEGEATLRGSLSARVTSTYPGNSLEFTPRGWACVPGASSPRAGHFSVAGAASSATVVVQLSGCVRCS